jgi:hypothetical protein
MAVTPVQFLGVVTIAGSGASTVLTISKTVTAGNVIIAGFSGGFGNPIATGITDNLGNVYTFIERVAGTSNNTSAEIWYAPITTGGALTTITAASSAGFSRVVIASEFTGQGQAVTAGGGSYHTASGSPNTCTGVTNKTIPANGLAVWIGVSAGQATATAGPNSGSPSTAIAMSGSLDQFGNPNPSIAYAIAGASAVTGFTGTTIMTGQNGDCVGAGATFNAALVSRRGNVTITDAARGGVTMSDSL